MTTADKIKKMCEFDDEKCIEHSGMDWHHPEAHSYATGANSENNRLRPILQLVPEMCSALEDCKEKMDLEWDGDESMSDLHVQVYDLIEKLKLIAESEDK